jgi:hypothetical protein
VSDPTYDGLCGVPCPSPLRDGRYLRCRLSLGHGGAHDWAKHLEQLAIAGGIRLEEVVERALRGSVAARALIGMPDGCTCTPRVSAEGQIIDYLFDAACSVHASVR